MRATAVACSIGIVTEFDCLPCNFALDPRSCQLGVGCATDDDDATKVHAVRLVEDKSGHISDTSGALPGHSGGNARFRTSLDTAVTDGAAADGLSAGGVTKIRTTMGTTSSHTMPALWECRWS
jgi:hypothetical protein